MSAFEHLRFELLLPFQLREIIAKAPVAYVPLGTLEWHCEHLPVGLDALTAHGLCLRAAAKSGGVVLPALHYGTGGDHGNYPFTVMMPEANEIESLLGKTLSRLRDFGFEKVAVVSGHFPDQQLEMIDRLATGFSAAGFRVLATAVNRIPNLPIPPDHAGVFETTLLYALHPELVQIARLPPLAKVPVVKDDWEAKRHDPNHPLWGIFGPDPRTFRPDQAAALLEQAATSLAGMVGAAAT